MLFALEDDVGVAIFLILWTLGVVCSMPLLALLLYQQCDLHKMLVIRCVYIYMYV